MEEELKVIIGIQNAIDDKEAVGERHFYFEDEDIICPQALAFAAGRWWFLLAIEKRDDKYRYSFHKISA